MKALTLSIVIPAYNEEHHLVACLDAIAKQSETPDEVIVVDNNSTDGTKKVARHYPFVRVLTESRQGVVFARTRGFDAAKSTIIGRIDADTILPVNWVEVIKSYYKGGQHRNYALTGGCYFYNVRLPRFNGWLEGQISFRLNRLLLGHYILYGSNMAFLREQWIKVKPRLCYNLDVHEDLDLAIHLHQLGFDITYRESLRVGVKMRRVRSDHRLLWDNLMWWPSTLRVHGKKTWVLGWLGAATLFILSPIINIAEALARLVGRKPLDN